MVFVFREVILIENDIYRSDKLGSLVVVNIYYGVWVLTFFRFFGSEESFNYINIINCIF